MRRLALFGLIGIALGGCALPIERPDRAMTWQVSVHPGVGARLVLGVPETDDVRLVMTCRPRSGDVEMSVVGRKGDPAVIELRSGKISQRYPGAGLGDPSMNGAVRIDIAARTSDPVLARLADTGELAVIFPTRRIRLPNAFSPAHDFLVLCRPR